MDWLDIFENKLYSAYYINRENNIKELWNYIKSDKELLKSAIDVVKDRYNEKDVVRGITISSFILNDYKKVDKEIYNELISIIYSNVDIARLGIDKNSLLLLSLNNNKLKLTDDMKSFLINEAMNCRGTVKDKEIRAYLSIVNDNHIYSSGINNVDISYPHGKGEYDIRYSILFNDNFTKEQKKSLLYDFYADDEIYKSYLNSWKSNIASKYEEVDFNRDFNEMSYSEVLGSVNNKDMADIIWKDICFYRTISGLRSINIDNNNRLIKKKELK